MRSRSPFASLVRKEWRELMASRAWWVLLALTGPLVGLSFIEGVRSFSEISEGAGTGCGAVCAPLVGIWGPTFGAYEISAAFLLPFVAIRMLAGDRHSGALIIEMQRPVTEFTRIGAKALVLLVGWTLTGLAAITAIALWKSYSGHAYAPEILVVAFGHVLNGALTIALGLAIAAVTDHPSTAAIITLAITIGTWIVNVAAAIQGGFWTTVAGFTPTAMVATFQHALIQVNVLAIGLILIALGLAIAFIRRTGTGSAGVAEGAAHHRRPSVPAGSPPAAIRTRPPRQAPARRPQPRRHVQRPDIERSLRTIRSGLRRNPLPGWRPIRFNTRDHG